MLPTQCRHLNIYTFNGRLLRSPSNYVDGTALGFAQLSAHAIDFIALPLHSGNRLNQDATIGRGLPG